MFAIDLTHDDNDDDDDDVFTLFAKPFLVHVHMHYIGHV